MTLAALDAGADVLCEKPTAMDSHEAKAMLDRAVALGRVHMIDHELRFNPNRKKIEQLIESGFIGQVRHAHITNIGPRWATPNTRAKGDWWSMKDQGGGRLGANGSHQIDLMRWWFGDPGAVVGQALTMVPNRVDKATGERWIATADDTTHFTLEMRSGAVITVFLSGVARHAMDNVTQIYGSEGSILLNTCDERLMVARAGEPFQDMSEIDPNASLPGVNKGIWNVSVVGVMRELAAAIAEKRRPKRARPSTTAGSIRSCSIPCFDPPRNGAGSAFRSEEAASQQRVAISKAARDRCGRRRASLRVELAVPDRGGPAMRSRVAELRAAEAVGPSLVEFGFLAPQRQLLAQRIRPRRGAPGRQCHM